MKQRSVVSEVMKPDIDEVVRKHGLTVDDLVKCGKGGLEANKNKTDSLGRVNQIPDWNVRHKFFSSFMELLGYLHGPGTTVTNVVTQMEKEKEELYKQWRRGKDK